MKVAVIGAKGLPAKQGGIEHHCEELYPRMVEQGHSVDLFARSSYTGNISLHQYDVRGVQVVSLPCLNLKGMDALLSSALGAIASSGTRYDIIHFHAIGPSLFSWLARFASTAKVVVTCHGLDWQRSKWSKASSYLLRLGERAAVRFADEIVVVSEELRSYFKRTYGRETIYIPNAPSQLGQSDPNFSYGSSLGLKQGRYILFLGRLVPEKCPDLLIKAFQTLQPLGWKLVLVGGTSDTDEYTSQIVNMTANSTNIVFTGELKGASLAEIIRGAGLFVLPSELEGLPLAMLEAMQAGVPVLASDIPVHKQLIGEKRGMLFCVNQVESCVRCLDWAIYHPQELATMAKRAQQYVQANFNWDDITTETLRLYYKLISTPISEPAPSGRTIGVNVSCQ
jgi:glycosyltransferase involved in cell wall biosynthesis